MNYVVEQSMLHDNDVSVSYLEAAWVPRLHPGRAKFSLVPRLSPPVFEERAWGRRGGGTRLTFAN